MMDLEFKSIAAVAALTLARVIVAFLYSGSYGAPLVFRTVGIALNS